MNEKKTLKNPTKYKGKILEFFFHRKRGIPLRRARPELRYEVQIIIT